MITRRELIKGMGAAVALAVIPYVPADPAGNTWVPISQVAADALNHLHDAMRYVHHAPVYLGNPPKYVWDEEE